MQTMLLNGDLAKRIPKYEHTNRPHKHTAHNKRINVQNPSSKKAARAIQCYFNKTVHI
jgi:hypothetical protein